MLVLLIRLIMLVLFRENFLSEMDDKGKGDFDFDSSWCQSERGDRRSLRSGPRHSPHVHGIH